MQPVSNLCFQVDFPLSVMRTFFSRHTMETVTVFNCCHYTSHVTCKDVPRCVTRQSKINSVQYFCWGSPVKSLATLSAGCFLAQVCFTQPGLKPLHKPLFETKSADLPTAPSEQLEFRSPHSLLSRLGTVFSFRVVCVGCHGHASAVTFLVA